MFDHLLRPVKDRIVDPLARLLGSRFHPVTITVFAACIGLAAALAAGFGALTAALVLWLLNRVVDGLDGAVARATGLQSDYGGYLDLLLDVVVYSALPVAFALGRADTVLFIVVMVVLAAFYVNITSWLYLSAIMEKRGHAEGRVTSIVMPRGLVEGVETIVCYTAMLAWPAAAAPVLSVMAAATLCGAAQRVVWARRHIR